MENRSSGHQLVLSSHMYRQIIVHITIKGELRGQEYLAYVKRIGADQTILRKATDLDFSHFSIFVLRRKLEIGESEDW